MSSPQLVQEDQLLELLLQLKKTTPDQARVILNSQPQIAYALMAVMVNLNAINVEVVQKALTTFSSGTAPSSTPQPVSAHAIPQHLANVSGGSAPVLHPHSHPPSRGPTPTYPFQVPAYPTQGPSFPTYPHPQYPQHNPPQVTSPSQPPSPSISSNPATAAGTPATLPDTLAGIPDDQKALIMRVISLTPDEINQMPPQERNSIIQLRATLGVST